MSDWGSPLSVSNSRSPSSSSTLRASPDVPLFYPLRTGLRQISPSVSDNCQWRWHPHDATEHIPRLLQLCHSLPEEYHESFEGETRPRLRGRLRERLRDERCLDRGNRLAFWYLCRCLGFGFVCGRAIEVRLRTGLAIYVYRPCHVDHRDNHHLVGLSSDLSGESCHDPWPHGPSLGRGPCPCGGACRRRCGQSRAHSAGGRSLSHRGCVTWCADGGPEGRRGGLCPVARHFCAAGVSC